MSNSGLQPRVLVFVEQALPASNTFIRSQMESLSRFQPHYIGLRYSGDIPLDPQRAFSLNQGSVMGLFREVVFKLMAYSPAINQRATRIDPCLIHAHFGPNGALCLKMQELVGAPLVVTFHGYDATIHDARKSWGFWLYLQRRGKLARRGSLFIAVSQFIKEKLLEQGFPPDRVRVHYIGIDTEYFRPDPQVRREPVVLFVGRLVEKKGCEYLIRAFSEVKENAKLVIIGDGPVLPRLRQLANENNVPCQFLGKQPNSVVKEWMNRAMVLCAPSVTARDGDSEGLPMVILEANAMGLPVVSTHHAGIPEAIVNGETGFLVSERDEQGLAQCLGLLVNWRETWDRFHNASMIHVRENFSIKKQTQLLEEMYDLLLQEHGTVMQ